MKNTESGLPGSWIDEPPAPVPWAGAHGNGGPTAIETAPGSAVSEPAAFGRSDVMIRRWRGWSFSFRRRHAQETSRDDTRDELAAPGELEPGELEPGELEPVELDLVALADEESWTELTLAALDGTDGDPDAWSPDLDADPASVDTATGPWATLAEEPAEPEAGFLAVEAKDPTTAPELEEEFWARGPR